MRVQSALVVSGLVLAGATPALGWVGREKRPTGAVEASPPRQPVAGLAHAGGASKLARRRATPWVPRRFTLAVTGDILLHSPVSHRAAGYGAATGVAYDYRPMFSRVRGTLSSADLALCHLETPLAPPGTPPRTGGSFSVPGEIATAIAEAGYDGCSTASNHSFDNGATGVVSTIDQLDAAGVQHTGSARTAAQRAPAFYDVRGVRVAHLAYTYGLNGLRLPSDQPYLVNLIDPAVILADAHAAREAGAEFVVVSLHWGVEFVREPTDAQRAIVEQLLPSSDIDLVIGHHAHVVQPLGEVGGTYVAFGLGNFLSNQHDTRCCPAASQDGVIMRFHVVERPPRPNEPHRFVVSRVDDVPTYVDRSTFEILPVGTALTDPAFAGLHGALAASWARTTEAVGALAVAAPAQ